MRDARNNNIQFNGLGGSRTHIKYHAASALTVMVVAHLRESRHEDAFHSLRYPLR
jgi:hypothetical protein